VCSVTQVVPPSVDDSTITSRVRRSTRGPSGLDGSMGIARGSGFGAGALGGFEIDTALGGAGAGGLGAASSGRSRLDRGNTAHSP
jgi:hypothetical protein